MASTYSTSLRLQLIGTGDQAGVWGTTTNTNLGTLLEQAITGVGTISLNSSTYTLSAYNGLSDQSRNAVLVFTGTPGADCTVTLPAVPKQYVVKNTVSGGKNVILTIGSGTTLSVPNGVTYIVYTDGINGVYLSSGFNPTNVAITGGTINGTVIGGTTPATGSFFDFYAYDNSYLGTYGVYTVTINYSSPSNATVTMSTTPPLVNTGVTFAISAGGSLPTGISSGVTYYVANIIGNTFNLTTTPGGSTYIVTTSGTSGTITMTVATSVTFTTPTINMPNGLTFNSTGAITLPIGTTANQPSPPVNGMIRYNSTSQTFEGYAGGAWGAIGGGGTSSTIGLWQNKQLITATESITSGYSAMSAGPITIQSTIAPQQVAITIASPGVFTVPTTSLSNGTTVTLSTTGALPTGLTAGTTYYVINSVGLSFNLATTANGSAITTTGTQSGTHTITVIVFVTVPSGSRWVIL